jgi:GntR family transcriptional regulator
MLWHDGILSVGIPGYLGIPLDISGRIRSPPDTYCRGIMSIDYEGDVPIYQQLARILREQIDAGEIPPRHAIPSKRTLMQEYGVAGGTVERALDELRADGYLKTVLGRGLYVIPAGERTPRDT